MKGRCSECVVGFGSKKRRCGDIIMKMSLNSSFDVFSLLKYPSDSFYSYTFMATIFLFTLIYIYEIYIGYFV